MIAKNAKKQATRRTHSIGLLWVMMVTGVVRIALATMGDLQLASPVHSEPNDAVMIRRDLQLVTSGLHALLAQYGLAVSAESADSSFEGIEAAGVLPGSGSQAA